MQQQQNIVRVDRHPNGFYGDGNQGNVDFDGVATVLGLVPAGNVYTMTADIEVGNMIIRPGVTVKANGFIPRINGILSGSGTLTSNKNNASGITAGAAIAATGTLQCSSAAGAGGRNTTGVGNAGPGAGARNISSSTSMAGGNADGVNVGGVGNTTVAPTAIQGKWRNLAFALKGRLMDNTSGNGGGGGGSGGANVGAGTAISGGGGSGAIPLVVFARYISMAGTIEANGGNGGNASGTGDGKAGGGGGGAAGPVIIVTDGIIRMPTIQTNVGQAGTGFGGGATPTGGVKSFYLIFTPNKVTIG